MEWLTVEGQKRIHANALRILEEVGLIVDHPRLLEALEGIGAVVDSSTSRVCIPGKVVEYLLEKCPRVDHSSWHPRFWGRAGVFLGDYLNPDTGEMETFDQQRVHDYFRLARALPNITSYYYMSCQWRVPPMAEPLYERLHAWKYGADGGGSLHPIATAPNILELCHAYADMRGKDVKDTFRGSVWLISPLRITKEEAEAFVWWWDRGFRVRLTHMTTGGLSAPITIAAQISLFLAEELGISLLYHACFGETRFGLFSMLACADMRTAIRPFGRPEIVVIAMAMAAMARFYGVEVFVQSGLSDAKVPSPESGAQKAMTTVGVLLAGASTLIDAGIMGIDQVYSPIQMILDNELTGAIERLLKPVNTNEESLAFDTIADVGPGGIFTDTMHTVRHFREETWDPSIWTRNMLSAWYDGDRATDADKARDVYHDIMSTAPEIAELTPDEEERLRRIIQRVEET